MANARLVQVDDGGRCRSIERGDFDAVVRPAGQYALQHAFGRSACRVPGFEAEWRRRDEDDRTLVRLGQRCRDRKGLVVLSDFWAEVTV